MNNDYLLLEKLTQDRQKHDNNPSVANFIKKGLSSFASLLFLALISLNASGQSTTLNTTIGSTGYTNNNGSGTNGYITFVIENNSGGPIKLTDVGNQTTTSHNGTTSTLWYSATNLSGLVGTLGAPDWTSVASQVVSGITTAGVNPVITGMSFIIPDGAIYRFALHTTGDNRYSGTGSVGNASPNNFTNATTGAGVVLYTGNYQIGGQFIGYGMTNKPRYFTGFVTFEPVITAPNNAGVDAITSPNPPFCAGNHPVRAMIKNSGTSTLNNVMVNWTLDGVAMPPVAYNTPIPVKGSAEVTLSNSELFPALTTRQIKIWTSMPNGMLDTVNTDDTLSESRSAGLSGVYTVGTGGDFIDVAAAADTLNKYGICSSVTMNILPGTYFGQVTLKDVVGTSPANKLTFQSSTGNPADVAIVHAPTGIDYVLDLDDVDYTTFKNVTITSGTLDQGIAVFIENESSHDSIVNCVINSTGPSAAGANACIYANDQNFSGSDLVIMNNKINRGYFGVYIVGPSDTKLTDGNIVSGNEINDAYLYSAYFYYTSNLKVRNNKINSLNSNNDHIGITAYYSDNELEISGNDVTLTGNSGVKYGIRSYYNDGTAAKTGKIFNNAVAIEDLAGEAYGIVSYYSKYQNYINNSVNVNSSDAASNAGVFYYTSTTYSNNNIVNNAFSLTGGSGYSLYLYNSDYNNYWDYNNIYSLDGNLVETVSPAGTFKDLDTWVTTSGVDENSISYKPGFTSMLDLRPNAQDPASWSLNGRGLHIATNNKDKAGNPRVELRASGVPDIGAYEFTPEVAPPVATPTPADVDRGDVQVFKFGQRTVATVTWGNNAPVGQLQIRQYSGEKGNGVVAAAVPAGTMYFHTDVATSGSVTGFDMNLNVDYMNIWLGDISTETNLRMAQRVQSAWSVYSGNLSSVNATDDELNANVNNLGSFTGLENNTIQSAFVVPQGRLVMCIGNSTVLNAEPSNGTYYKWFLNNNPIPGAEGPNMSSYTASQGGDYSVQVTANSKLIESAPVTLSTISAPTASIGASGALTYCTGNGLTLNAGSSPNVTYQWQLNNVNIPGANSSSYAVTQAGDYTVLVENIGCATSSTPTTVNAGPLVVNLGNDTSFCEQTNVFAKLDAGFPGAKYVWSTGQTSQTIEAKQTGTYWVRVDGGPGCIDTDTVKVKVDKLPSAQGISFVQNGNTYQFFASGLVGVTGYMWLFSDGTTTTVDQPTKTITTDLYVRLVLFNGCGSDTVQLGWPLTVDNVGSQNGLSVYPNPASDNIIIKLDGNRNIQSVTILNTVGAVVNKVDAINAKERTINVSNLPAGNYMMTVQTDAGIISQKFNVVR